MTENRSLAANVGLLLAVLALVAVGAYLYRRPQQPPPPFGPPQPQEVGHLHNVFRIAPDLWSGNSPETDADFAALAELGVRTVISVDGAAPLTDLARVHGLKYIHLPYGYDGIPAKRAEQLARAVRESPGRYYIHCHHGKHRGPAGAAILLRCLDSNCDTAQAFELLKVAGTDPRYVGLYESVKNFTPPPPAVGRPPLPETTPAAPLVDAMVSLDEIWTSLQKSAPNDRDRARRLALLFREQYAEMVRLPEMANRDEKFKGMLAAALENAKQLEAALAPDAPAMPLDTLLKAAGGACKECHVAYRDTATR